MGDVEDTDWYQVSVARGSDVNKSQCFINKWVECCKHLDIGGLWQATKSVNVELLDYNLVKVSTVLTNSMTGKKLQPMDAPMTMPLSKLKDDATVWFIVQENSRLTIPDLNSLPGKNAFEILMTRKKHTSLKPKDSNNKKDELYNDLLSLHKSIKFPDEHLKNITNLFKYITDALWTLDGCHQQINTAHANNHCRPLPDYFSSIYNKEYYDWRNRKRQKPTLSSEKLLPCSNNLFDILSVFNNMPFIGEPLVNACRHLAETMRSYSGYLEKAQVRMTENREFGHTLMEKFSMPNPISASSSTINLAYASVDSYMKEIESYCPINIDNSIHDFGVPEDRKARYVWFRDFQISCRVQLYKYNAGGRIGNITFVWKIGEITDQTMQHKTVSQVEKMIPQFESCYEAREMREKYSNVAGLTPVLRRNLVQYLTGKTPQNKSDVDALYEEFTCMPFDEEDEAMVIYDRRKTNQGRPDGDFHLFYEELDGLLEEYGKAAEERRHSLAAHMPLAVSVPQLISKVKSRLEKKGEPDAPIPSVTTVRYQFNPGYLNRNTVSRYKSRIDIVCKIQRRQLRKFHEDTHFVNSYFLNLKKWCVENADSCTLIFMDDKAKVPVGEPGVPESATLHMRKALTTKAVTLESSDHSYHSVNLTPSVSLICTIPESPTKSFFTGQIYVGIKDSVFESSDPLRHGVELLSILRNEQDSFSTYLSLFTDGGGDHNITFLYVQCVLLALFKIGNFDVMNVGRCAPNQSWINPAERCMSLLNIGLQGLALQRDHAGLFEKVISSCKSMKALRNKAGQHAGFQEAYMSAIEHPRRIVEAAFTELELKGEKVKSFQPNRDDNEIVASLHGIEPLITDDASIPHARAKLRDFSALESYLEKHLTEGLYLLQFRKCQDNDCCQIKSSPLPPPVPSPVLAPDGQHYLPFEDLYGKVATTEKDCPSLNSKTAEKKKGPSYKFLSSRVVSTVECALCGKSRCVFSMNSALSVQGERELEDIVFSCGMELRTNSLYTARHLKCSSPMENAGSHLATTKGVTRTAPPIDTLMPTISEKELTKNVKQNSIQSYFGKTPTTSVITAPKVCTITIEPSVPKETSTSAANVDFITEVRVTTTLQSTSNDISKVENPESNHPTKEENSDNERSSEISNEICRICKEEDPPGYARVVKWVDCDICHSWAHFNCAKVAESMWVNIRRKNWLCDLHK